MNKRIQAKKNKKRTLKSLKMIKRKIPVIATKTKREKKSSSKMKTKVKIMNTIKIKKTKKNSIRTKINLKNRNGMTTKRAKKSSIRITTKQVKKVAATMPQQHNLSMFMKPHQRDQTQTRLMMETANKKRS